MPDLFDQLAAARIPPPPEKLHRTVHDRVNRALLVGQLAEFAFRAIPFAALGLMQAVGGWMALTFSGRFPPRPKDDR